MERIIECVPNFSEGRRPEVIEAIAGAILSSGDVRILHIDRGEAANRTVITFAGSPEAVAEAAFRGVQKAAELIDMRVQHGTHPRSGATDVLPLVPVKGITLEECAIMARRLAERIFMELGIPCYCYEAAAFRPERKRLEVCRSGEYESLREKIADPERRPDFSPEEYNDTVARSGAINVGARDFLIAVNFNLDTASVETATEIAKDVRESGRVVRIRKRTVNQDNAGTGNVGGPDNATWEENPGRMRSRDEALEAARIPGTLEGCKAIGWYIEEYGIAQVSMNITDIRATPLHKAFVEVCRAAVRHGVNVTGTEIIGLVPENVLTEAGRYFLAKSGGSTAEDNRGLIDIAVRAMHLDDLCPFDPEKKILEYCM